MFAFDLQTRFAKAWFDTALTGLAVAGSMGTAMAQTMGAWGTRSQAWSTSAGPFGIAPWSMFPATLPATAWPWCAFSSLPGHGAGAWRFPAPFLGPDWIQTMGLSPAWPLTGLPYMAASSPTWNFLAAFAAPPQRYAEMFWPDTRSATDMGWPLMTSYRTYGGHAAAVLFKGFDAATASHRSYVWPDFSHGFFKH
jgi:hypothetical protein